MMKRLVVGILAHVDAGKTTLSEALLYCGGNIRRPGRVDHQNAFLDNFEQERERGITIFSKQAVITLGDMEIVLLDTPGHADFAAETERTLKVLDYAVLVVSMTDGVQAHTKTLWRLLKEYKVPTLVFVNKGDLAGADYSAVLQELKTMLDSGCVDFSANNDEFLEQVALCDEKALATYLDTGALTTEVISKLIQKRRVFPCISGSALKMEGIEEFINIINEYSLKPKYADDFGAIIYKISRDRDGTRLTHMKITGGMLKVKEILHLGDADEKVNEIRIYSGAKYETVQEVVAGQICAVVGPAATYSGQGLGIEDEAIVPILEPVMNYKAILPETLNVQEALRLFKILEDEDPQLHVDWHEQTQEIHLHLMGQIQLEVLEKTIKERFLQDISFDTGSIIYRETIKDKVVGIGHFEPLRHYAEVQLLLEPTGLGTGLSFLSTCSLDVLDSNWQNLVLTHLQEVSFPGVLTGSPITDMKITLLIGRAHLKHTEGGDFRQATYRAVQHGLKMAESIVLEPWYGFEMQLPTENIGRAMSDIQQMHGDFEPPESQGDMSTLRGNVPVSEVGDYQREFSAYTHGSGRILLTPNGYRPCHNEQEVIEKIGYDSDKNPDFTANSVFCSHGAGYVVKWDKVAAHAHLESGIAAPRKSEVEDTVKEPVPSKRLDSFEQDKELMAIFERTYGTIKQMDTWVTRPRKSMDNSHVSVPDYQAVTEYLLVDGYNVIFAWGELKKLSESSIEAARKRLMDLLVTYRSFRKAKVILVFDAYKVAGGTEHKEKYHNIDVVYTKQAETADAYIERVTYTLARGNRVRVVTSDYSEQIIILGHGALRVSAAMFYEELATVQSEIREIMDENNLKLPSHEFKRLLQNAIDEAE